MNRLCFITLILLIVSYLGANNPGFTIANPSDLKLDWWKQFDKNGENRSNLSTMTEDLRDLRSQLTGDEHEITRIEIDQLIFSINETQKFRAEEVTYEPTHLLYLSEYTLSELFENAEKIHELKKQKSVVKEKETFFRQKIDSFRSQIDMLLIEYPLTMEGTIERLQSGLQMMNLRFQIEVLEIKARNQLKLANLLEDNIKELQKEQEVAYERLNLETLAIDKVQDNIQSLRSMLVTAEKQLLEARKEGANREFEAPKTIIPTTKLYTIKAKIVLERLKKILIDLRNNSDAETVEETFLNLQDQLDQIISQYENLNELSTPYLKINNSDAQELQQSLYALNSQISNSKLIIPLIEEKVIQEEFTLYQYYLFFLSGLMTALLYLWDGITVTLFRINDNPVTPWLLLRAVLIILFTIALSRLSTSFFKRFTTINQKIGRANTYIISRLAFYTLLFVGFVLASYSIGIDMTKFVIIAGALGVGVGLGLQSIVNNFFSGLVVLFAKLLKVGDVIETENGFKGTVKAIRMQNTHIRTFDGKDILIPNADLVTNKVVNWTMASPFVRMNIPFGIEYGADRQKVETLVLDLANKFDFTINDTSFCPKPKVWLVELGDNALILELVVWVNIRKNSSIGDMEAEYLWGIEQVLTENGIDMPFPQTDIYIKKLPPSPNQT